MLWFRWTLSVIWHPQGSVSHWPERSHRTPCSNLDFLWTLWRSKVQENESFWNSFSERMTPAHKFLGRERVKKEEWSSRPLGQEARGSDPPICIGSHCVVDVRPPGHKGAGTEQILQLLWSQAPISVLQTHTQHPVQVTFTIYICTHSQCGWPSTHNQCEWPSTHNLWMTQHPQSVWMTQHPQSVWMTQHP